MKTELKKLEKDKVKVRVEVPAEAVTQAMENAAKKISGEVNIPGFRRGKAPYDVVEKRVGKEGIAEEATRLALPAFYAQAVSASAIEPITSPDIDVVEPMELGKALIFEATVDVKPDVKLGKYKGIKVEKPKTEVSTAEVEAQIAVLRDKFAELADTLKITADKGDFVVIDFEGSIDGKPFEGGSASDYILGLGSKTLVGDFEDQLVGTRKGEEKTVIVRFPEDYGSKMLAGKAAYFKVTVKDLKQKKVPPYDEKFAEKVGFKSKQELEDDLKTRLKETKGFQAEVELRRKVIDAVSEGAKVDVPKVLVDEYTERLKADFDESLAKRGLTEEDYARVSKQSLEDIRKQIASDAATTAKTDLVFDAIGKKEKIEVSYEEVEKEVERLYGRMGESNVKKFRDGAEGAGREQMLRNALAEELRKRKTVDFLVKNAQYGGKKSDQKGGK